jgi:hypothetical protein
MMRGRPRVWTAQRLRYLLEDDRASPLPQGRLARIHGISRQRYCELLRAAEVEEAKALGLPCRVRELADLFDLPLPRLLNAIAVSVSKLA